MASPSTQFVGIREFSQKLFRYLKKEGPVVIMKRGKPHRLISPVGPNEVLSLGNQNLKARILSHPAVGIWKNRWKTSSLSESIVQKMRRREESRSFIK